MSEYKIKAARAKKGFTQSELSKRVGICVNNIVKIEKGDYSTLKYPTMIKIAEALNSTVQELFF